MFVKRDGTKVRIGTQEDKTYGWCLFVFSDEEVAKKWWSKVPEVELQVARGPSLLAVAEAEHVDALIIDPHDPEKTAIISKAEIARLARIHWGNPLP